MPSRATRHWQGSGVGRDLAATEAVITSSDVLVVCQRTHAEDVWWKLRALGGAQFWHDPTYLRAYYQGSKNEPFSMRSCNWTA